jgi:mitosis inhibitor protein kinase SWE1
VLRAPDAGAGSSESEEEGTPTKGGGERLSLAGESSAFRFSIVPMPVRPEEKTPTPSPAKSRIKTTTASGIYPRLSLPAFAAPKQHRTLHHRQSHPAAPTNLPEEDDLFEKRFITLDNLGKGAFSTVVKVQDRHGDGLYAVKKARGVFDGVKDR